MEDEKTLREKVIDVQGLKLWLSVGCAACRNFDLKAGCQDQHGLELTFGMFPCKWLRRSYEAYARFVTECNFSALQNELLALYYEPRKGGETLWH